MSNNIPDSLQTTFKKRGIKTQRTTEEVLTFVGKNSKTTFAAMAERMVSQFTPTDTDVATLGEAYESGYYRDTPEGQKTYESLYGEVDFTVPVAQDETNREILDEIFGNNDNDPTGSAGGINEEEAKEIIGRSGTTKLNSSSLGEKHSEMLKAQTGMIGIQDEESAGVRGSEDKDAPIDAIA